MNARILTILVVLFPGLAGLAQADPLNPEQTRALIKELDERQRNSGDYKALAYACGPCHLCDECDLEGACRHPRRSRPAMEACGIDVFATARAAGFPIDVVTSRDCPQNYYGLVLVE